MEEICKNTVEALKRRGFEAVYCATAEDASSAVMAEVDAVRRVGMGGSVTMKELGLLRFPTLRIWSFLQSASRCVRFPLAAASLNGSC